MSGVVGTVRPVGGVRALLSNGQKAPERAVKVTTDAVPSDTPEHYCQEHSAPFKRHTRGENVWWSRKPADGKWCREK